MKIEDLLKINLKIDLLKELKNRYDFDSDTISKKEYRNLCESKIDFKIKDIIFLETRAINPRNYLSEEMCCARIWDSKFGTRCRYKRVDTDYCNHHNSMIKRTGKLYLNRYDEDKPILDEKGNRFPWLEDSNIVTLDNIIQKQDKILKSLINKDR